MEKLSQVNIGEVFNSPFGKTDTNNQIVGFGNLISLMLKISFVLAGVIILFMIIFAGIKMIQGAGSGNAQEAEKGKQAATSALIGFVIIFSAYWIIMLIELITGVNFITNPGF